MPCSLTWCVAGYGMASQCDNDVSCYAHLCVRFLVIDLFIFHKFCLSSYGAGHAALDMLQSTIVVADSSLHGLFEDWQRASSPAHLLRVLQVYPVFDHIKVYMVWYKFSIINGHRPSSLSVLRSRVSRGDSFLKFHTLAVRSTYLSAYYRLTTES